MNIRTLHNSILLLYVIQALLLILKLARIIDWSWLLILIPVWAPVAGIMIITAWIYTYHMLTKRKP